MKVALALEGLRWSQDYRAFHFALGAMLAIVLLVVNLVNRKWREKSFKMTVTLANGYSFDRTQQELSNEYQHGRIKKVFKNFCIFVPLMKVASALKG